MKGTRILLLDVRCHPVKLEIWSGIIIMDNRWIEQHHSVDAKRSSGRLLLLPPRYSHYQHMNHYSSSICECKIKFDWEYIEDHRCQRLCGFDNKCKIIATTQVDINSHRPTYTYLSVVCVLYFYIDSQSLFHKWTCQSEMLFLLFFTPLFASFSFKEDINKFFFICVSSYGTGEQSCFWKKRNNF